MTLNSKAKRTHRETAQKRMSRENYERHIESVTTLNGIRITKLKPGWALGAETVEHHNWKKLGKRKKFQD